MKLDDRAQDLQSLHYRIEHNVPGKPEHPGHHPFGMNPPKPDCPRCDGTGWEISVKWGTFFICPCVNRHDEPSYRDYAAD